MKSKIAVVLFALPFAIGFSIGGWFGLSSIATQLWQAVDARHWEPVSASVINADLVRQKKTLRVTARYQYRFNGKSYEGTRVGFTDGSDNIGSWHDEQYRKLANAKRNGSAIQIWVDPANPERALVDRSIRWAAVAFLIPFATLFPMVSLGACWVIYRVLRAPADPSSDGFKIYRNAFGIQSNTRTKVTGAWVWATLWGLMAFPIAFVVLSSVALPSPALFVLIFPLVGLLLFWDAVRQTVRWRRHGDIAITLSPEQPRLGATIKVRARFGNTPPEGNYTVALLCEEKDTRGENNRTRTVWRQERVVRPSAATLNASFLPSTVHPASEPEGSRYHRWRILLRFPDGKDEREFDVVISPAGEDSVAEPVYDVIAQDSAAQPIPSSLATVVDTMSRLHITFGTANMRNTAIVALVFGAIFASVGGFLLFGEISRGSAMPKMMGLIFAAVGVAIMVYGVYAFTHRRTVEITQGRVRVANRWLFKASETAFAVNEVKTLAIRITGSTTVGNKQTDHYEISASLRDGSTVALASNIGDAGVAQSLRQLLQRRLDDVPMANAPTDVSQTTDVAAAQQVSKRFRLGIQLLAALMAIAFFWDFIGAFFEFDSKRTTPTPAATVTSAVILSKPVQALFDAVDRHDTAAISDALARGADINATNDWGATALIVAASRGEASAAIVQQLISRGADINFAINMDNRYRGRTALIAAAHGGRSNMVETLLNAEADAEKFESEAWSALHYAAYVGDINSLRAFHRRGIKLDLPSPASRGETPLMVAARVGKLNVIRDLIELGADPRLKDRHGENTYGWAKFFKQDAAMEMLKAYQ